MKESGTHTYLLAFAVLLLHKGLHPLSLQKRFFIIHFHIHGQLTCSFGAGGSLCLFICRRENVNSEIAKENQRAPVGLPEVKLWSPKERRLLEKCDYSHKLFLCFRCGNNFCASHRYAETHSCTYDYKSAGRRYLQEANPVVNAPKLPKI